MNCCPISVAVAWMIGGLVFLELGLWRKSVSLRAQAYLALACSFGRIFVVNLNAQREGISPRLYTVVPLRWPSSTRTADCCKASHNCALRNKDCTLRAFFAGWVQPLWPRSCVLNSSPTGWRLDGPLWHSHWWQWLAFGQRVFLHQSLLLRFGISFRAVFHNFYQRSYFPPPLTPWYQSRWVLVGSVVALIFLALADSCSN